MDPAKPPQSICSLENLEVSGNSSACPSKMGEGEDEPSHRPLPKVMVRSKEVPLNCMGKIIVRLVLYTVDPKGWY